MQIFSGKKANNWRQAAVLASDLAGRSGFSPDVAGFFASAHDGERLGDEVRKSINAAVHSRYGRTATWHGTKWFVPLPQPKYDSEPVPRITFSVQWYLIAGITVNAEDRSYEATVVGPIGKAEKMILPLSFFQAILDDDLDKFQIVGKDGNHTSWSVPGFRASLRLPGDFVDGLADMLRSKTVWTWLLEFGSDGKAIAPLVAGSFLGLQLHDAISPLPPGKQPFRREAVLDHLTRMYGSAVAAEMLAQAAPFLKSIMTNDEALSLIFKETGRRK